MRIDSLAGWGCRVDGLLMQVEIDASAVHCEIARNYDPLRGGFRVQF